MRRGLAPMLLIPVLAQAGGSPSDPVPEPPALAEIERVRLVLLSTSVTTRRGKPVRGLEVEDFRLSEGGVPREIGFFATEEDAPIALAFLLDVSGSMRLRDRLTQAQGAIRYFVGDLDPEDRIGLICFADDQVTWVTEFTSERDRFLRRLDVQEAAGKTALYDALAASPSLVDEGIQGRKAIVLITDGLDNASELPTLRAVWLARRVNVPIYTLSFLPMREKLLTRRAQEVQRILGRFSSETGGALYPIHDERDLQQAVAEIQAELRFQYVIGFYPPVPGQDRSFRPLDLTTTDEELRVRTRRGYYGNP